MHSITKSVVLIQVALIVVCQATKDEPQQTAASGVANQVPDQKVLAHNSEPGHLQAQAAPASGTPNQMVAANASGDGGLVARTSDRNFIKDIVDRLHALDADIGKLLYNSTSMYAPNDQASVLQTNPPKGGERMTEVLADLDSLQDEVSAHEYYLVQH